MHRAGDLGFLDRPEPIQALAAGGIRLIPLIETTDRILHSSRLISPYVRLILTTGQAYPDCYGEEETGDTYGHQEIPQVLFLQQRPT